MSISAVKLGLLVAWPAFWTGFPLKLVIGLLLAMGVHPWEMPGLGALLVLSIPIDIWALNLSARTVFLERLRLKAPEGIGLTIWWQVAVMSAVYLPILYLVESQTIAIAKGLAAWFMEFLKEFPVAERISIELTLWGAPATIVLILLVLGWLFLVGTIIKRQAAPAVPAEGPLPVVVRQWDLMRVPRDQPLMLTAFTGTGAALVLLLWAFMPVTTPHPHESYQKGPTKVAPPFKPTEALQKSEKVIAQAEATVQALEEKAATEKTDKKDEKGKAPARKETIGKEAPKPSADAGKHEKTQVAAEKPAVRPVESRQHE